MIEIPPNNQWQQTNRSDIFGNLQGTFNIDFTKNLGKLRVTRTLQTTSQVNVSALSSYPVGFKVFNDGANKIWTVAGSKVLSTATPVINSAFAADGTASSPTTCDSTASDIEIFNGNLYVTTFSGGGDKLYQNSAGTWTNAGSFGAQSVPHMMAAYASRLYISGGGGSAYKIYSTADGSAFATSGSNSLTLDQNYIITFLRASSSRIWIGTIAKTGKGYIFEWDGASTQATRSYRLEAQGAISCVIKDDVPWVTDTNGRLIVYSSGTFTEKARLPIDDKFLLSATNTVNNRFIHPNGMSIINGKVNILINNLLDDSAGSIPEFCSSGIWEYDETIGIYHKYSPSYTTIGSNTITDYGQNRLSGVGALSEMKLTNSNAAATGNFLAGITVFIDASSTNAGIFTNDTFNAVSGVTGEYATQGGGYIVTTKTVSSQVADSWQKLYLFYKQFLTSSDSVVGKYRTTEINPTDISIIWTSTTTFTTTTNVLGLEGYEVEVTQGTGGGKTAHITKIDVTGGVYSVTVDNAFTGVTTGTAKARLQNWIKIGTIQDQTSQFKPMIIGKNSNWVQFKICFMFTGSDEFNKMLLLNKPQQIAD